ncbi:hypothetical protein [Azospirillum canadense]|uniref:hypothetical protein n=1 Tax=Azospirillum canadense TaxID=403962 RepID=UPI002225EFEA|nr:hypothetical protein [Azospirillum canadense]MCW2238228.1 hypothetical protein [Azospirillum canadense]
MPDFRTDPEYYFYSDGSIWVPWALDDRRMCARSKGHRHEIVEEYNKYSHPSFGPDGYLYFRDGEYMGALFSLITDAIEYVEEEINAQVLFDRKLWPTLMGTISAKDRDRILAEKFYQSRLDLVSFAEEGRDLPLPSEYPPEIHTPSASDILRYVTSIEGKLFLIDSQGDTEAEDN